MNLCIVDHSVDTQLYEWALEIGLNYQIAGRFCIYRGHDQFQLSDENNIWLLSKGYERLFESCYLPSTVKGLLRAELVRALFVEVGGTEYSESIVHSMNVGCYDAIYQGSIARLQSETVSILDVGCGIGTILESSAKRLANTIMGFDFVDKNLEIANYRGLLAIDKEELITLPNDSFDILFSCYVLHYESLSNDDITLLVRLLKHGGIWAANFHKSKGLSWFINLLRMNGEFKIEQEASIYGSLLFARKA